ncbi:soluble NSF attachment family protein [Actinokineospora bangkokensis]|uniref:Tetratricopeptide repeat protein n=1 Tax=Actinokineospora bangkokensis TaxID=1193682 RepID=A0A1Q9LQP3_9PSEU|nr:hypothetical protein [Actinokineospora bangkokensis]OLR94367.1 hypothetical protein BJP25_11420 [Actinokineospora bangkokensis]
MTTIDRITEAVALGHAGDPDTARARLGELWDEIGPAGDAFHRCVLSHYLADLHDDPAQALVWDVRALDAAASLTDERVRDHHASLHVAGFYPSLHLNLADNFRRLGSFDAARHHLDAARERQHALGDDGYGEMIRGAIAGVGAAIERRSTAKRTG